MSTEQQGQLPSPGQESTAEGGAPSDILANEEPSESQSKKPEGKVRVDYLKNLGSFLIKPKTLLEMAALIVVICYTRYAGQQVQTMNDTLSEIRKQTKSSQRQADDADTALRAYVVFEDAMMVHAPAILNEKMSPLEAKLVQWSPNTAFTVTVSFKNIGDSQAVRMRSAVNMEFAEIPDHARMYAAQEACFRHTLALVKNLNLERPAVYGTDVAPQQPGASLALVYDDTNGGKDRWATAMTLRPETVTRLVRDQVMIVVAGIITYSDIFNFPHETYFCIGFANANPKAYSFCDTHNRIR